MKPLVTEREFYDQCSIYVNEKRSQPPGENEQRTYFLLCMSETEEHVGSWAAIVDPAVPHKVKGKDLAKMTWGQQILVRSSPKIQKLIEKVTEEITMIHGIAKELKMSPQDLVKIIAESDSPEDAKQKLLHKTELL